MPLRDLLNPERISIVLDSTDRGGVLDAAASLLAGGDAARAEAIGASLRAREQLASTAIGHGVAIPHGRVRVLEDCQGAFLRLSQPVDFGALDGVPVDLVIALAVPEHFVQQHLHRLAELAEHFADAGFRQRLREADDVDSLQAVLFEHGPARV